MVAFRNFKKSGYRKKTGSKKRSYPKKKTGVSFEKRVKTVISKMAENKSQAFRISMDLCPYTSTVWDTKIVPMTPDTLFCTITQGTGQGNRIGNSIRVKSLKFNANLRCLPYNATTNALPVPCFVKLLFLTRKDTPTNITSSLEDVLQFGNGSEGPGNSQNLFRMMRPINTDEWTYHTSRTYKLGFAAYEGVGSAGRGAQMFFANNDFKLNHFVKIDLTKYCTKTIKFDDNSSDPSTRNIVMYPLVYAADYSDITNQFPVAIDYSIDIVYEDM